MNVLVLLTICLSLICVPNSISDEPEAGLKGAAILGAAGAGLISDPAAVACERRAAGDTIQPNPQACRQYEPVLDEYRRIYNLMLGFWQSASQPPG